VIELIGGICSIRLRHGHPGFASRPAAAHHRHQHAGDVLAHHATLFEYHLTGVELNPSPLPIDCPLLADFLRPPR